MSLMGGLDPFDPRRPNGRFRRCFAVGARVSEAPESTQHSRTPAGLGMADHGAARAVRRFFAVGEFKGLAPDGASLRIRKLGRGLERGSVDFDTPPRPARFSQNAGTSGSSATGAAPVEADRLSRLDIRRPRMTCSPGGRAIGDAACCWLLYGR